MRRGSSCILSGRLSSVPTAKVLSYLIKLTIDATPMLVKNVTKMRFIIPLTIFSIVTESSLTQTTREPHKDIQQNSSINTDNEDPKGTLEENKNLRDLWIYKPPLESHGIEQTARLVDFRTPHSLTRLAKSVAYGFEPHFSKGYFEPFERRPKLVTLVALRRHGLVSRKSVLPPEAKSMEVAELQSPYNGINDLWMEAPIDNIA